MMYDFKVSENQIKPSIPISLASEFVIVGGPFRETSPEGFFHFLGSLAGKKRHDMKDVPFSVIVNRDKNAAREPESESNQGKEYKDIETEFEMDFTDVNEENRVMCLVCRDFLSGGDSPWSICFDPKYKNCWGGEAHEYRALLCQTCAEKLLKPITVIQE